MSILVASTMARYVTDRLDTSCAWLMNAEDMVEHTQERLDFFAAFETDSEGLTPFDLVCQRLEENNGDWYEYQYDDGRKAVTTSNRLWHICAGRNIIQDRAMDSGASHILFLDADMAPPADAVTKLLELDYPIVGGEVPTYGLRGPKVEWVGQHGGRGRGENGDFELKRYPFEWCVQQHMNTAGFLLVAREVFKRVRWRWSLDDGSTDDPCYEQDAREFLGYPTYVRHDVVGCHFPESIPPIENRFPERDMSVSK